MTQERRWGNLPPRTIRGYIPNRRSLRTKVAIISNSPKKSEAETAPPPFTSALQCNGLTNSKMLKVLPLPEGGRTLR